ncbi:MAG: TRAM domain-containing protein, partial [Dehalococcoidia bacterium]|nr:TRAM domain-containing protein [Dehalococcoidia bacterium]
GRRGLELLNKLKKEADVPIQVSDIDFDDTEGVDAKLVKLARQEHSPIITNDYNLNRVAELQGVRALNINELAIALRPVVLSGEEMDIRITQEGKEPGQGVGFLDDGTMVVVEGGRRHLNSSVGITITRVLQTAMGRMIFAQVKNGTYHERG